MAFGFGNHWNGAEISTQVKSPRGAPGSSSIGHREPRNPPVGCFTRKGSRSRQWDTPLFNQSLGWSKFCFLLGEQVCTCCICFARSAQKYTSIRAHLFTHTDRGRPHACIYSHIYVHMYMRVRTCLVCMCMHPGIHPCTHVERYIDASAFINAGIRRYIHAHTHTYEQTSKYAHKHTHTQIHKL